MGSLPVELTLILPESYAGSGVKVALTGDSEYGCTDDLNCEG